VVIDTIGFSGEAPAALLSQIAADTGGTFRFVPTTPGTAMSGPELAELSALGAPPELIERLETVVLPGPLGLDDVYDYFETKNQDASRLFHYAHTAVPDNQYRYAPHVLPAPDPDTGILVDASVTRLRLVAASKQADDGNCGGDQRVVEVSPPNLVRGQRIWYPVSPPESFTPASWDIRHSLYDDVVIIPNPQVGLWQMRTRMYNTGPCAGQPEAPTFGPYDFMMNGSVETDVNLQGRLLGLTNNQGTAGQVVSIMGALLNRNGAIPGAIMIAGIEKPGDSDAFFLFDDGAHSDGAAGDGIYGADYSETNVGGSYNVRLLAGYMDPGTGNFIIREWLGGFWIDGPDRNDVDKDGMPDDWERRCKLDPTVDDTQGDLDKDGLSNLAEFHQGTLPCDPDTDNGGERDGSEVAGGRNPLNPQDDRVRPLRRFSILPFNSGVLVHWAHPISYTRMLLYLSTDPGQLGQPYDLGRTGTFSVTGLINNQPYYATLAAENGPDGAGGAYSDPQLVTPKEDPDPPSGAVLINNGAAGAASRNVVLNITSTDEPLPGVAQSANAHGGNRWWYSLNGVSGNVEMMVSNDPSFAGAVWEPLASVKPWTLGVTGTPVHRVYVKFRDGAGNESYVVYDDIALYGLNLPIIYR
jgi:hypothetical protein